jgi:hypothetical protein
VEQLEREIRNGVVDILCFLSSGNATLEQMSKIEMLVSMAAKVAWETSAKEKVGA